MQRCTKCHREIITSYDTVYRFRTCPDCRKRARKYYAQRKSDRAFIDDNSDIEYVPSELSSESEQEIPKQHSQCSALVNVAVHPPAHEVFAACCMVPLVFMMILYIYGIAMILMNKI